MWAPITVLVGTVPFHVGTDYAMWALITVNLKMLPTSQRNRCPHHSGFRCPHPMESPAHIDRNPPGAAQLIRALTDEHFWSETYDRELRDTLALESEVAQSIARKVQVTITGEERARLVGAREISPEVYESYLKGREEVSRAYSRAEIERSLAYFEEAIRKDPTFAPAYVGLADAYGGLGLVVVGAMPPGDARER